MEASTSPRSELSGEKATRIVEAMRDSVARRGAAGSTFEQVAREAGVSRGLLHYYFATKERLLVEVVRRDAEQRVRAIDEALAPATTIDEVLEALVASLNDLVENEPETFLVVFELFTAGRRHPEIQEELGQLILRLRRRLAEILEAKQAERVLSLRYPAESVASHLFAIADGVALQALSAPELNTGQDMEAHISAARHLLAAD